MIAIDFETYYDNECSVKMMSPWSYARHPKFDAYLVTIFDGQEFWGGHPRDLNWSSLDGEDLVSHNAAFDRAVQSSLGEAVRPRTWNCSANLMAAKHSRRSLKDGAKQFLGKELSKDVRTAMKGKTWDQARTLRPLPGHESEFSTLADQLMAYAKTDAIVAWELWEAMSPKWSAFEQEVSLHTLKMCERGFLVDLPRITECVQALQLEIFEARKNLPWLEDGAPALSHLRMSKCCVDAGIEAPKSLAEDDVNYLTWEEKWGATCSWARDMRRVRKANTLLQRFLKLREGTDPATSRFQFGMKYFGAHTGRWSGDTGFNVQNFPREPYVTFLGVGGKPTAQSIECDLRAAVVAGPGKKFIVADLAQIEARVLAFMAEQWDILDLVAQGQSIYEVHARKTMGWTGGKLKEEDPKLYRLAKARVLSLGYGCGLSRFRDTAKLLHNLELSEAEAKTTVKQYRNTSQQIVRLWQRLANGLRDSLGGNYEVELPSGRSLMYFDVGIDKTEVAAIANFQGPKKEDFRAKTLLQGAPKRIWGSLICENLIQAVARDVMAEMILELESRGMAVLFHVHDEVIVEVDANADPREVEEVMSKTPVWLEGCPIGCEWAEMTRYAK